MTATLPGAARRTAGELADSVHTILAVGAGMAASPAVADVAAGVDTGAVACGLAGRAADALRVEQVTVANLSGGTDVTACAAVVRIRAGVDAGRLAIYRARLLAAGADALVAADAGVFANRAHRTAKALPVRSASAEIAIRARRQVDAATGPALADLVRAAGVAAGAAVAVIGLRVHAGAATADRAAGAGRVAHVLARPGDADLA